MWRALWGFKDSWTTPYIIKPDAYTPCDTMSLDVHKPWEYLMIRIVTSVIVLYIIIL